MLVSLAGSIKHLKELVLQLAVQGRLSVATGETADELTAELERRRPSLAKLGIRVGKDSVPVSSDEAPHSLPDGWRWIRLRDLGGFLGGGTPDKSNSAFWDGDVPWVSPKDMKRTCIDDSEDHISQQAVGASAVKLIPARSVLYVVRGMILAHSFPVAVAARTVTINQDMKALVLVLPEMAEFVLRSLQAARIRVLAKVERSTHGTCRLESETLEQLVIALPPLGEQARIVERVDELLALCDELEAGLRRADNRGSRLVEAVVRELVALRGAGGSVAGDADADTPDGD